MLVEDEFYRYFPESEVIFADNLHMRQIFSRTVAGV